jgi:hypothetical protein
LRRTISKAILSKIWRRKAGPISDVNSLIHRGTKSRSGHAKCALRLEDRRDEINSVHLTERRVYKGAIRKVKMRILVKSSIRWIRYKTRPTKLRIPVIWFRHRGLDSGDVLVASYPRSGNTWLRFLLFEILTGESAEFEKVLRGIPYVGGHHRAPPLLPGQGRLVQTHEWPRGEYKKAIFLVRDPRDIVVSEYGFERIRGRYTGEFNDFIESFLLGEANPFGSWQSQVEQWLASSLAKDDKLLLVRFEDLRSNTEETITRILEFLGVSRVEKEVIRNAIANNSVQRMREKEDHSPKTWWNFGKGPLEEAGRQVRSGSIGRWKEELTPTQLALIERHLGDWLIRLGYLAPVKVPNTGVALEGSLRRSGT